MVCYLPGLNKKPIEGQEAIKAVLWSNQSYLSLGESWPQKTVGESGVPQGGCVDILEGRGCTVGYYLFQI